MVSPFFDTDSKQKVRSTIVKFKSWGSRAAFYKSRPINFMNGRKKPGPKSFSVLLDLMKRHYALSTKAKGVFKDNPSVAQAFCDINCSLAIKFNDNTYKYLNCENELRKLLVLQLSIFVLNCSEAEVLLKQTFLKWIKSFRNIFEGVLFVERNIFQLFFFFVFVLGVTSFTVIALWIA